MPSTRFDHKKKQLSILSFSSVSFSFAQEAIKKSTAQALQSPPAIHTNLDADQKVTNKSLVSKTDTGDDDNDDDGGGGGDICLTPGCIHAASNALDQLDESVEPCDDFYSFACGNFVKNTVIPDEKVSVNTFSIIGDKLQEQLRTIISAQIDPADAKPVNLAKQLYKACMNKSLIEERGLKPLTDIVASLGGWPVVSGDQWDDESAWTWIQAVKDFRKMGYSMDYIFDFSVGIDLKNSTARTIDVSMDNGIAAEAAPCRCKLMTICVNEPKLKTIKRCK